MFTSFDITSKYLVFRDILGYIIQNQKIIMLKKSTQSFLEMYILNTYTFYFLAISCQKNNLLHSQRKVTKLQH